MNYWIHEFVWVMNFMKSDPAYMQLWGAGVSVHESTRGLHLQ